MIESVGVKKRKLPNIIIMVWDDIAWDWIPFGGEMRRPVADWPVTPNLDLLAQRSAVFRSFYTSPICSASRATLHTGLTPSHHGIGLLEDSSDTFQMDQSLPSIGTVLRDAGYNTLYTGKWHIDPHSLLASAAYTRGWKSFRGVMGNAFDYNTWDGVFETSGVSTYTQYRPQVFLDWARDQWLTHFNPKALMIGMSLPHAPWHIPPPSWTTTQPIDPNSKPDMYRSMIEAGDYFLGQLMSLLGPDDYFFLISDNGTPKQGISDWPESKGTLKEPGINVPLLVCGPGVSPGDRYGLAASYDLLPTLAHLVGQPIPESDGVPWVDMVPPTGRQFIVQEAFTPNGFGARVRDDVALIRKDGWKLIRTSGVDELYLPDIPDAGWDGPALNKPQRKANMAAMLDDWLMSL